MKCKYEEKHFLHSLFKIFLRKRAYAYNYAYKHYVFEFLKKKVIVIVKVMLQSSYLPWGLNKVISLGGNICFNSF